MTKKSKKLTAVVPIKMNNERLPGKNTKLLGGKPLIQYILTALDNSKKIDKIYVYCSDESIKDYFIDSDKVEFLKRPAYLDEPTSNFTQIFEAFSKEVDSDYYVFAHATAPFLTTETIDKCIDNVTSGYYDSSFTAEKIQDFLWSDKEPINFEASNVPRSQDLEPVYRETSGVYVFEKEVFDKYKRRIGVKPCPVEVPFKESIDINYPKDFEMAELFYNIDLRNKKADEMNEPKKNISLLDCTLRDGGCVNSFAFGNEDMNKIKTSLEDIGLKFIELGYINDKKGKPNDFSQFDSIESINKFLNQTGKKKGVSYFGMIDYGTYDFSKLPPRTEDSIDGIRLAFHKKDLMDALQLTKIVSDNGYDVFVQPMVVMNYSDEEIMKLINFVNKCNYNIKGLYIVDSFGQMIQDDVIRLYRLFDSNLKPGVKIGFHGHNNMQMAYANSLAFLNASSKSNRELMLDATIDGMGKGAGNLPTEIITDYLNKHNLGKYDEKKVFKLISDVISKYKEEYTWGYDPKFLLSSMNGCTPSHVNYFVDKRSANLDDLYELLQMLDPNFKIASNSAHAEEVFQKYMELKK